VRTAASTLRQSPALDAERAITELAVGEALVSFLDAAGSPCVAERAWIVPPASRIGPLTAGERQAVIGRSVVAGHYEQAIDRESAYEKLAARAQAPPQASRSAGSAGGTRAKPSTPDLTDVLFGRTGPRGGHYDGLAQAAAKSAARTIGSSVGREIIRGLLGSMFGRRR
jgi:hypothetical protein